MNESTWKESSKSSNVIEFRSYMAFAIVLIALVMNLITLEALRRSQRLSYNVRVLSINMVVADLVLCAFIVVFFFFAKSMLNIEMDEYCMITYIAGVGCFWTFFATSFSVTAMAVDRFISMKFPYQYLKIVSDKRCKNTCYGIWFVSLLASIAFNVENREKFYQCYFELYRNNTYLTGLDYSRYVTVGFINLFILLVNLFAHSTIIIFIWRKKTLISQGQRRLLKKLWTISLAYAILHGPFNLLTIVIGVFGLQRNITLIQVAVSFTPLMVLADPILYTWRYKTCRYQVMMMLCRCCKGRINDMRQRNKQFYCTYVIRGNLPQNAN